MQEAMVRVVEALKPLCHVKAVNFISPNIVVELEVDGTVYRRHSLPGRVAGHPTLYYHSSDDYWRTQIPRSDERPIVPDPDRGIEDETSYLEHNDGRLCPGVRLSSSLVTDLGTYARASLGTTSGVLLRKNAIERLTVSNHGFPTNEVYHPTVTGSLIGEITTRMPLTDIAMAKILPPFAFTNARYFDSIAPTRLLKHDEVSNEWCTLDGMSTGVVYLQRQYDRIYRDIEHDGSHGTRRAIWAFQYVFESFGPTVGNRVVEGVCGAPIVTDDGGVAGLFHQSDVTGRWSVCATLDPVIAEGWQMV
jgi:hypothetical protein